MIRLLVLLLTFALHINVFAGEAELRYVKEQLAKMPSEDREKLHLFFEALMETYFPYTLFGDKPVSEERYNLEAEKFRKRSCLANGKRVWEKYAALFPSPNFILKFYTCGSSVEVYLINKKAFLTTVEAHLKLFKAVLGENTTPENLLEYIRQDSTNHFKALRGHSLLIGLLHGYGYANSSAFHKIDVYEQATGKWLEPPYQPVKEDLSDDELMRIVKYPYNYFCSTNVKLPPEFRRLLQEEEAISTHANKPECDDSSSSALTLLPLPGFRMLVDDPESAAIKQKYIETRRKIIQAYAEGDFLEVTLCKLIEK